MTNRNAVFTGSNGAAWPALDNGDTWATSFWASPTIDPAQIQTDVSATVNGSNVGVISATHNLSPRLVNPLTFSTTTASTSFKYTAGFGQPSDNGVSLIFVITSATYSHQHVINGADCTGSFLNQTYTKVTETEFSITGPVYWHLTIFRTVLSGNTAGNVVVTIQTAAGGTPATQATGGSVYYACATSTDTTNNGANAIRANSTAASATTGQPAVTLPSNVLRYSSLPIALMVHNQANTSSDSSDAKAIATTSFATPNTGAVLMTRTVPAVGSIKTTAATMTAAYASATSAWGALGIEVLDSNTNDTYTDRTRDYMYTRISSNTADASYEPAYVYAEYTSSYGTYGPWPSLIARYVDSGGTKYWLYSRLTLNDSTKFGQGACVVATDNGTSTTHTTVPSSTSPTTATDTTGYTKHAMRVRTLANGNLWVSAKWWSSTEPAWPAASDTASSIGAGYLISNGIYSTNDALRNASAAARTGLAYTYPATDLGDLFTGDVLEPTDGTNTLSWSVWKTTQIVDASATITGLSDGASAATAAVTHNVTVTLEGTSDGSAAGYALADATVTLTGTSNTEDAAAAIAIGLEAVTLSGVEADIAATTVVTHHVAVELTATADLAADGEVVAGLSSVLSGAGDITASGNAVSSATSTLAGAGDISVDAAITALASAAASGAGVLSASAIVLQEGTEVLSGAGDLSGVATVVLLATASLSASGALAADPSAEATADLSGAGTLTASGIRVVDASAVMTGASDGTADGLHLNVVTAALSAAGALAGESMHIMVDTATLTAVGALATTTVHENNVAVVLVALGQLAATTGIRVDVAVGLTGAGSLAAAGGLRYSASASLAGAGGLVGDGKWVHYITNSLRTTASRKVGSGNHISVGQYDGDGSYGTRKIGSGIMTTVAREQT